MPRSPLRLLAIVAALLIAGQAGFAGTSTSRNVRVQPGDSLWSLSGRYGVSMQRLAAANGMRLSDLLLIGRTLQLPATGRIPGAADVPTVRAGDAWRSDTRGPSLRSAEGRSTAASPRTGPQSFCATYVPPTGPRGQLPAVSPDRLALRPLFAKWAKQYRVPVDLLEAQSWQESGWQNDVVSPDRARGIGQMLPETAVFVNRMLGTDLKLAVASDNIQMMAAFVAYLLRATGGQVCPAVAAYYQGLGALQRYGVLPVSESYVRSVLSLRPRFR